MAAPTQKETTAQKTADKPDDDELNELLDSALADFDTDKSGAGDAAGAKPTGGSDDPISDVFAEEFSDEMAKQFEDAMKSFMADDPAMLQQIEKLAEAAGNSDESQEGKEAFGETLKQTLSSLAQNTEGLQDPGGAAGMGGIPGMAGMGGMPGMGGIPGMGGMEDMMKMFGGMGMDPGAPDDGFMPMMSGMMKTLLSRDVLYPSLKEISDKYPKWLEDNKDKIKESEYTNYNEQHKIIGNILAEFDKENPSDTDDVKKQHFEQIMDLMQKMQDLGQPPKEIVGDMAPGLEFDANGVPKFPGTPEGCSVM